MRTHAAFFEFLGQQTEGAKIQEAYRAYKAESFELNGRLKGGLEFSDALLSHFKYLKRAICAKNSRQLRLYRMTSDAEFRGSLLQAIERQPLLYPAFMSTSVYEEAVDRFVPNSGTPLLLRILVPPGNHMALMEADSGLEGEVLLGCGTVFQIRGDPESISGDDVANLLGRGSKHRTMKILELSIHSSPPYTGIGPCFDFE